MNLQVFVFRDMGRRLVVLALWCQPIGETEIRSLDPHTRKNHDLGGVGALA